MYNVNCTKTKTCLKIICNIHSTDKKSLMTPESVNRRTYNKVQKDKQRSTKHTYKTKDRVTRTPLETGVELRYSGR